MICGQKPELLTNDCLHHQAQIFEGMPQRKESLACGDMSHGTVNLKTFPNLWEALIDLFWVFSLPDTGPASASTGAFLMVMFELWNVLF